MPYFTNSAYGATRPSTDHYSGNIESFTISYEAGEEPSYSIDGMDFSGTIEFEANDDIVDALMMMTESAGSSRFSIIRKLRQNRFKQKMPDNPIGTWTFNQFSEQYNIQRAASILAGEEDSNGGADALLEALFEEGQAGIGHRVTTDGRSEARAFNDETSDWPHDIRMRIAGYIYNNDPDWLDSASRFAEELYRFADGGGYAEGSAIPDEFGGDFDEMPENPFDRVDYSNEMATAYCIVWANGENPEEIDFEEVSDLNDFRWWVEKTGDLDDSLRAHHFGRDVPIEVVRQALPPEEWGELEPTLEENEYECVQCMNIFYEMETPDGIKSVHPDGQSRDGSPLRLDDDENPFLYVERDTESYICPQCANSALENNEPHEYFIGENGEVAAAYRDSGIVVDYGAANPDSGFATANDLDAVTQEAMISYHGNGTVYFGDGVNHLMFTASSGPSSGGLVREAFNQISESGHEIANTFNGPIIIDDAGRPELSFFTPANRPDIVVETKQFIKEPTNV